MSNQYGQDVSIYDDAIAPGDWGVVIIRRGIGLGLDPKSDGFLHDARARGIPRVGWYWYITAGDDPAAQAAVFLRHAAGADFICYDVEGATSDATARAFCAAIHAAGHQVLEYVQKSRRNIDRGADGEWVAAWGYPNQSGALLQQKWSSDDKSVPRPPWAGPHGDWNEIVDVAGLDAFIARHTATGGVSVPYNLVPITCHRRVALKKGVVLFEQDRKTPYVTLGHDASLGYVAAADATWALIADGDALCYVKRADFGAITTADANVGN